MENHKVSRELSDMYFTVSTALLMYSSTADYDITDSDIGDILYNENTGLIKLLEINDQYVSYKAIDDSYCTSERSDIGTLYKTKLSLYSSQHIELEQYKHDICMIDSQPYHEIGAVWNTRRDYRRLDKMHVSVELQGYLEMFGTGFRGPNQYRVFCDCCQSYTRNRT